MYENTIVDSVYGCLPGSIWGGCRIIKPNKYCDAQTTDIYDLRDNYYDLGNTKLYINSGIVNEIIVLVNKILNIKEIVINDKNNGIICIILIIMYVNTEYSTIVDLLKS